MKTTCTFFIDSRDMEAIKGTLENQFSLKFITSSTNDLGQYYLSLESDLSSKFDSTAETWMLRRNIESNDQPNAAQVPKNTLILTVTECARSHELRNVLEKLGIQIIAQENE